MQLNRELLPSREALSYVLVTQSELALLAATCQCLLSLGIRKLTINGAIVVTNITGVASLRKIRDFVLGGTFYRLDDGSLCALRHIASGQPSPTDWPVLEAAAAQRILDETWARITDHETTICARNLAKLWACSSLLRHYGFPLPPALPAPQPDPAPALAPTSNPSQQPPQLPSDVLSVPTTAAAPQTSVPSAPVGSGAGGAGGGDGDGGGGDGDGDTVGGNLSDVIRLLNLIVEATPDPLPAEWQPWSEAGARELVRKGGGTSSGVGGGRGQRQAGQSLARPPSPLLRQQQQEQEVKPALQSAELVPPTHPQQQQRIATTANTAPPLLPPTQGLDPVMRASVSSRAVDLAPEGPLQEEQPEQLLQQHHRQRSNEQLQSFAQQQQSEHQDQRQQQQKQQQQQLQQQQPGAGIEDHTQGALGEDGGKGQRQRGAGKEKEGNGTLVNTKEDSVQSGREYKAPGDTEGEWRSSTATDSCALTQGEAAKDKPRQTLVALGLADMELNGRYEQLHADKRSRSNLDEHHGGRFVSRNETQEATAPKRQRQEGQADGHGGASGRSRREAVDHRGSRSTSLSGSPPSSSQDTARGPLQGGTAAPAESQGGVMKDAAAMAAAAESHKDRGRYGEGGKQRAAALTGSRAAESDSAVASAGRGARGESASLAKTAAEGSTADRSHPALSADDGEVATTTTLSLRPTLHYQSSVPHSNGQTKKATDSQKGGGGGRGGGGVCTKDRKRSRSRGRDSRGEDGRSRSGDGALPPPPPLFDLGKWQADVLRVIEDMPGMAIHELSRHIQHVPNAIVKKHSRGFHDFLTKFSNLWHVTSDERIYPAPRPHLNGRASPDTGFRLPGPRPGRYRSPPHPDTYQLDPPPRGYPRDPSPPLYSPCRGSYKPDSHYQPLPRRRLDRLPDSPPGFWGLSPPRPPR